MLRISTSLENKTFHFGHTLYKSIRSPLSAPKNNLLTSLRPMSGRAESTQRPSFGIFTDVPPIRVTRRKELLAGQKVGFVPTLGALHEGHLQLMRIAAKENQSIYVSIFLNPTQFGVNEDLDRYPKTWDEDISKLEKLNEELDAHKQGIITAVFAPSVKVMYPGLPPTSEPDGYGSFVNISPLASMLEGASRPVFFRGVATVCMKLINIVEPENVYFGQKDIQQVYVIKRMVEDFHLNTKVRVGPTVRESDGLALSSRNVYLGTYRRAVATVLHRVLATIQQNYQDGVTDRHSLEEAAKNVIDVEQERQHSLHNGVKFYFDYISIADPQTLQEVQIIDSAIGAVLSGAVIFQPMQAHNVEDPSLVGAPSAVRLIDNIVVEPTSIGSIIHD